MSDAEYSQETVLTLFLDAKLAQAKRALAQAGGFNAISPSAYTTGSLLWCKHQVAVIEALRRDADRPGQTIANYVAGRLKRKWKL